MKISTKQFALNRITDAERYVAQCKQELESAQSRLRNAEALLRDVKGESKDLLAAPVLQGS